jgi:hypothetical protein
MFLILVGADVYILQLTTYISGLKVHHLADGAPGGSNWRAAI